MVTGQITPIIVIILIITPIIVIILITLVNVVVTASRMTGGNRTKKKIFGSKPSVVTCG